MPKIVPAAVVCRHFSLSVVFVPLCCSAFVLSGDETVSLRQHVYSCLVGRVWFFFEGSIVHSMCFLCKLKICSIPTWTRTVDFFVAVTQTNEALLWDRTTVSLLISCHWNKFQGFFWRSFWFFIAASFDQRLRSERMSGIKRKAVSR